MGTPDHLPLPYTDVQIGQRENSVSRMALTNLLSNFLVYPFREGYEVQAGKDPIVSYTHRRPDVHRVDYRRRNGYAGYHRLYESVNVWGNFGEIGCKYISKLHTKADIVQTVRLDESGGAELKRKNWIDQGETIDIVRHRFMPLTDAECEQFVGLLQDFALRSEIYIIPPPPITGKKPKNI